MSDYNWPVELHFCILFLLSFRPQMQSDPLAAEGLSESPKRSWMLQLQRHELYKNKLVIILTFNMLGQDAGV